MNAHQTQLSRQRGNTLTGIIIGLVIGLGIAVAVALLITKSSTPFTNKGGKSDKADVPQTQLQDPNKPLYGGKEAARDAAKDFAKDAVSNKPADAAVNKMAEAKTETKPAADKAADKTAEAVKPETPDDKYVYFLQAGAFKEQPAAENGRAKLALLGFEARIVEKSSDTGVMYHVRIGPFSQVETMNRMRAKLSENGVDVAVVRTAK
ncbi:MAG: SPOR domain-containing protein [Burkholderiales bacterium]|nr:SPOR domain-containing protein [Burkholderiales bacterium]